MKLLQLNMWLGRLTPQIVQLVSAEQPDILTAQEVFTVDGPVVFPDNMFNCFEAVKAAGGFGYSFFSPLWSTAIAHQQATMGNAIFSKYPIVRQSSFFTNGGYVADLTPETRQPNTRNMQLVSLDVHGTSLAVANHHAHWEATPEGSPTSKEKMLLVKQKLAPVQGPLIFAGDLNVNPGTPALAVFDGMLEDLSATHHLPSTLSVLGKVPDVTCDHIFINQQIRVKHLSVSDALVSDHKALILEFEL